MSRFADPESWIVEQIDAIYAQSDHDSWYPMPIGRSIHPPTVDYLCSYLRDPSERWKSRWNPLTQVLEPEPLPLLPREEVDEDLERDVGNEVAPRLEAEALSRAEGLRLHKDPWAPAPTASDDIAEDSVFVWARAWLVGDAWTQDQITELDHHYTYGGVVMLFTTVDSPEHAEDPRGVGGNTGN